MNTISESSAHLAEAIVYTLVDSLLLGCMFALLTGALLAVTRKSGPVMRYNLLLFILTAFLVSLIVCFFYNSFTGGTAAPDNNPADVQHWMKIINEHAVAIFRMWFVLVGLQLVKLSFEWYKLNRLAKTDAIDTGSVWADKIAQLSSLFGIRRKVGLKVSAKVSSPLVIGFFKPLILLPIGLINELSAEEVELILLHELAHIKRGDFLVNMLIRLARILLFFNPLIWWLCKLIDAEREHCCDDHVIKVTGDKIGYVRMLVRFAESRMPSPNLAMTLTKGMLGRVERLVAGQNRTLARLEIICLAVILILGLLLVNPYNKSSFVSLARPPARGQDSGKPPDAASRDAKKKAEQSALKKSR